MQLLDDLGQDGVLNDGERESIIEENGTRADMARSLIDIVKKKGDKASSKMIAYIQSRDSSLYEKLGLSCSQPAGKMTLLSINYITLARTQTALFYFFSGRRRGWFAW